ncbi:excalibur calcium-binding domain-containing protein [Streptomyces roseolilacinus]|uniref:Excalibur calcium-binding domain-containing protein n=1 Tax=Streptomyces roseolilacinus TaxID=66904 RepID=A0A918ELI7_9ACTN|nr:excalibur calcium-binding domain-containing protein [Streptomyces roseolilacinus]GGQ21987.1 hypothetical protein GCM10010249_45970 [Streptomyces roseolilacinus]
MSNPYQQPHTPPPAPATQRPLHRMKRVWGGGLLLLLIGGGCGAMGDSGGAEPAAETAAPAATVTATATVTASPPAPASAKPAPTVTVTTTATATATMTATATVTREAPADGDGSSGGGTSGGGTSGGGSVFYDNCSAARAAGAAPVRLGDPGYGRHLDRDGDGVGCEG